MKASVKLREEEGKPPLVRLKLPISVFSLPFTSAVSVASTAADLSFDLRSALPFGPSLKLSYRPSHYAPFSLSLSSGIGVLGSPRDSPLLLSAHFSPLTPVAFSLTLKPRLGDFSLKTTAISNPNPNPNPNPKENGGGVYHPIPVPPREQTGLEDLLASGVVAVARTSVPVGRRAAVRLRWGVNMPKPEAVGWGRLPYLSVDKISIEAVKKEDDNKIKEKKDLDADLMKGAVYWMGREVEELQKENRMIKENVEELKRRVFDKKVGGVEGFGKELEVRRKNSSAALAREIEKETKKKPFVPGTSTP
ncbi:hypothetical protein J5N97_018791 [Dioscorea zingiberensis]|uniref:Uncharacterized protein n=1 Tax=Dioscorea zingiberensis TaxID=325984 RepID=A0A9D5HC34_9LILI|nr:hypothetical protein J5N97_018791 [Dioscorea zingiberensis]